MHRLLGRIRKQQLLPHRPLARWTRYTDTRIAQGVGLLTTSLIQSALLDTPNPLRRPRRLSSARFLFLIQPSKPLLPRLLNLRPGVRRTKSRQQTSFSLCAPRPGHCLVDGSLIRPQQLAEHDQPSRGSTQRFHVDLVFFFFFLFTITLISSLHHSFPGGSVWAAVVLQLLSSPLPTYS